jgi:hypothetical protein
VPEAVVLCAASAASSHCWAGLRCNARGRDGPCCVHPDTTFDRNLQCFVVALWTAPKRHCVTAYSIWRPSHPDGLTPWAASTPTPARPMPAARAAASTQSTRFGAMACSSRLTTLTTAISRPIRCAAPAVVVVFHQARQARQVRLRRLHSRVPVQPSKSVYSINFKTYRWRV